MKFSTTLALLFIAFGIFNLRVSAQDTNKQNFPAIQTSRDSFDIQSELDSLINQAEIDSKLSTDSSKDSLYFKIIKSFDIFGAFYRELIVNYVVELNPEEVIQDAINGITWNLDPYTNFFFSESDLDEVINYNSYVGLGIVVGVVDNHLMVLDFTDSLAQDSSGLKIGDKILKIDSMPIPPDLDTLKKYTSGKPNTKIKLTILRIGVKDTLDRTLTRRQIQMSDVSFSSIYEGDSTKILYIKIDRFSSETPSQVRNIVSPFLRAKNGKGIVLDVRDNPGGTLESAISICEMFLPPGATIVSIEGKNKYQNKVYKSVSNPLDTTIPLVVLVNSSSASASEVLAGAFQDNDRAVIIGQPTFGKGLIQSILDLPYDSYLKITTAKYFTPSGRSLHRLRYPSRTNNKLQRKKENQNSFHTLHNREVFESSGIQPDIVIEKNEENPFISQLKEKYVILRYVSLLDNTGQLDKITSKRNWQNALIDDFINYLVTINFKYKSELVDLLDSALYYAEKNNLPLQKIKSLEKVKMQFTEDIEALCYTNKSEISKEIEKEIQRRQVSYMTFHKATIENDPFYIEAVKILNSPSEYLKKLNKNFNNN